MMDALESGDKFMDIKTDPIDLAEVAPTPTPIPTLAPSASASAGASASASAATASASPAPSASAGASGSPAPSGSASPPPPTGNTELPTTGKGGETSGWTDRKYGDRIRGPGVGNLPANSGSLLDLLNQQVQGLRFGFGEMVGTNNHRLTQIQRRAS